MLFICPFPLCAGIYRYLTRVVVEPWFAKLLRVWVSAVACGERRRARSYSDIAAAGAGAGAAAATVSRH